MSASGYYSQQFGGGGDYGQAPQQGGYVQPPPPPPNPRRPWVAEWDQREGRYIFINQQTGQRSWEFPREDYDGCSNNQGGYGSQGGAYGGAQDYDGRQSQSHGTPPSQEQHQQKKSHGLLYGALGAAAGLAGGAFLMHEGSEVKDRLEDEKYRFEERFEGDKYRTEERFNRDEYRTEERFDRDEYRTEERFEGDKYRAEEGINRFGERVEDFPENAARWTGEKVGEVEDIPQDIEQGFDRFGRRIEDGVQDVEDIPEDVAGWAGDKVGDMERFGDNIDNAYDDGRDEGRYGDDDSY